MHFCVFGVGDRSSALEFQIMGLVHVCSWCLYQEDSGGIDDDAGKPQQ